LPVFILLGLGSVFAGVSFHRIRKKMPFIGSGMLSLGFLLWGVYLGSYPFCQQYQDLHGASLFSASVVQLFIAVSMIVLVLEEVRYNAEQMYAEMQAVRSEKDALQMKVITAEEECRNLYDQVRLSEGIQKAYEELRRTQQVVVQQERLRALGQMASGVAHDINNALTPICGYTQLLYRLIPQLSDPARRALDTMTEAAEDISRIVARMREFYRKRTETEELRRVDINHVIDEVIELTRPKWRDVCQRAGISINIKRELDPAVPMLMSDPSDLREALINLIFNAIDALPKGGTVTLVTRSATEFATNGKRKPMKQLEVEVRDDGVGMDEKTRQRCLEPFFSTKAKFGGTGLGLAMVYGMMQRHEGSIEVESVLGEGTSIRLKFPVREEISAPAKPAPSAPEQQRSLRVLCIDDEHTIRQTLNDSLSDYTHRVTVASGGKRGLELFREALRLKEPYEVVITDLGMPDMDGHQVARVIKAESPKTPVIMMTGWGTMMREDGERAAEVDAIVPKPPRIQELNKILLEKTKSVPSPQSPAPGPSASAKATADKPQESSVQSQQE
jgi:signal transduction histidine kinase/CheY-like chemotaxis protein